MAGSQLLGAAARPAAEANWQGEEEQVTQAGSLTDYLVWPWPAEPVWSKEAMAAELQASFFARPWACSPCCAALSALFNGWHGSHQEQPLDNCKRLHHGRYQSTPVLSSQTNSLMPPRFLPGEVPHRLPVAAQTVPGLLQPLPYCSIQPAIPQFHVGVGLKSHCLKRVSCHDMLQWKP